MTITEFSDSDDKHYELSDSDDDDDVAEPSNKRVKKEIQDLTAMDVLLRQCAEHVLEVFLRITSALPCQCVWNATPDSEIVLAAWNSLFKHCGASVEYFFEHNHQQADQDEDIAESTNDSRNSWQPWKQRHHQFSAFKHRKFSLWENFWTSKHANQSWNALKKLTNRWKKLLLEDGETTDIDTDVNTEDGTDRDDEEQVPSDERLNRLYPQPYSTFDKDASEIQPTHGVYPLSIPSQFRGTTKLYDIMNTALADEQTVQRWWHSRVASGASGLSLRITAVSDAEVFGCSDTRKALGLCAIYVFLHLHAHHVCKLEVVDGGRSSTVLSSEEDIMSSVMLRALRMCTQVRVVQSDNLSIAEACMASMGCTANITDINIEGVMRVAGSGASCAAPFANGLVSRESSLAVSGLTLNWMQRILNTSVVITANSIPDGNVEDIWADCSNIDYDDRGQLPLADVDDNNDRSRMYILTKPEKLQCRPPLTTLILHEPIDNNTIRMFISVAALCSETLQDVELVDYRNFISALPIYTTHISVKSILEKMKICQMKYLRILRIIGVYAIDCSDIDYISKNVNAPLRKLALRPSLTSAHNNIADHTMQLHLAKLVKHFQRSLTLLEIGVIPVFIQPQEFVQAVGEVRLNHSTNNLQVRHLAMCAEHETLTCYARNLHFQELRKFKKSNENAIQALDNAIESKLSTAIADLKAEVKKTTDDYWHCNAIFEGLAESFECDVFMLRTDMAIERANRLSYVLNATCTEVPTMAYIERLNALCLSILTVRKYDAYEPIALNYFESTLDSLLNNMKLQNHTTVYDSMVNIVANMTSAMQLNSLYLGITDATYITSDRLTAISLGKIISSPSSEEQLISAMCNSQVVCRLSELYLNGVFMSESAIVKLAKWIANCEDQKLCCLTLWTSRSATDKFYSSMCEFNFSKTNYNLVELNTMACKKGSGADYDTVMFAVRRNIAELRRAAVYVLKVAAGNNTNDDRWGPLSLLAYRNHKRLASIVCGMAQAIMTEVEANELIQRAVSQVSYIKCARSVHELHAVRSIHADRDQLTVSKTEELFTSICTRLPHIWDRIRDDMAVGPILLTMLNEVENTVCDECIRIGFDDHHDPTPPASFPSWAIIAFPEITPQLYVYERLNTPTIKALYNEMVHAHRRNCQHTLFQYATTLSCLSEEMCAMAAAHRGLLGLMERTDYPHSAFRDYVLGLAGVRECTNSPYKANHYFHFKKCTCKACVIKCIKLNAGLITRSGVYGVEHHCIHRE